MNISKAQRLEWFTKCFDLSLDAQLAPAVRAHMVEANVQMWYPPTRDTYLTVFH